MAVQSKQIIEDNGFKDVITVIQSKLEDIQELPEGYESVDIIIRLGCVLERVMSIFK